LAQNKSSYPTPDWVDVATLLSAFEAINNVHVLLTVSTAAQSRGVSLGLLAQAYEGEIGSPEARCLASSSATCSATGLRSLDAALIHLLYALDAQLASREFASVSTKGEGTPAH